MNLRGEISYSVKMRLWIDGLGDPKMPDTVLLCEPV